MNLFKAVVLENEYAPIDVTVFGKLIELNPVAL